MHSFLNSDLGALSTSGVTVSRLHDCHENSDILHFFLGSLAPLSFELGRRRAAVAVAHLSALTVALGDLLRSPLTHASPTQYSCAPHSPSPSPVCHTGVVNNSSVEGVARDISKALVGGATSVRLCQECRSPLPSLSPFLVSALDPASPDYRPEFQCPKRCRECRRRNDERRDRHRHQAVASSGAAGQQEGPTRV